MYSIWKEEAVKNTFFYNLVLGTLIAMRNSGAPITQNLWKLVMTNRSHLEKM